MSDQDVEDVINAVCDVVKINIIKENTLI